MKSQQRKRKPVPLTVLDLYRELMCALYTDVACAFSCNRVDIERELKKLSARLDAEGMSFFTRTLPSFAKAIDTALANGSVLSVPGFSKRTRSKLPKFLGWLTERVFDSEGMERPDGCPIALRYLRQLLYIYKRLELPYTDKQIDETIDKFVQTDTDLHKDQCPSSRTRQGLRIARNLIARVLAGVDPYRISPKHGPGAVATGEKPWEKSFLRRFYAGLESGGYSFWEYFSFSPTATCDRYDRVGSSPGVLEESTAKVVLVPKDSKGPRLISMEPLEVQWIQQGQMSLMVKTIESHPLTRGFVNFTSQEVNRRLALSSSIDQEFVTLDLKDASDRVALNLVQMLFPENWVRALEASRSSCTQLPDGRRITLNKFAPMGSAVCFPVEALVFWAVSVAGIYVNGDRRLNDVARTVYVYGDDVICKRKDYPFVIQCLEEVGLRVNRDKCCVAGHFRESCGCDAYRGVDVTPVRVKAQLTPSFHSPRMLASWVAYSNALYEHGFENAAWAIELWTQSRNAGFRIPYTTDSGPAGIAFIRPYASGAKALNHIHKVPTRFCRKTHRLLAKGPVLRVAKKARVNDTWEGVLHSSLCGSETRSIRTLDDLKRGRHGRTYPIPERVSLVSGWFPISV